MFGYIVPSIEVLDADERERYHDVYCGLCRSLGECCGQRCRLALTYDLAFLALLLGSLYEPDECRGQARCAPHPFKPHGFARSECTDYAADVTVALAYYKALDDWQDDRSVRARAFAAMLAGPYRDVRVRNPRICEAVDAGMADIGALEQAAFAAAAPEADAAQPAPDAAANRFGALMGELFVYRPDDYWADDLRRLGARLGKFVYVMDAAMDFEDDREAGSYNPLVAMNARPEDTHDSLKVLMGGVAEAFERLPLERDLHLMRSVVYAGVWQKYNTQQSDKEKRRG
ncbi:MAG: DUF5685 family protein [Gordonibacter sp.]